MMLNIGYLTSSIDSFNSEAIYFDFIGTISMPDFYLLPVQTDCVV